MFAKFLEFLFFLLLVGATIGFLKFTVWVVGKLCETKISAENAAIIGVFIVMGYAGVLAIILC